MPSQADRWGLDAEQAVLNAMINLPISTNRDRCLISETVIPHATGRLLETTRGALDDSRALSEIIAGVKRLADEGIIAASRDGIWKRLWV